MNARPKPSRVLAQKSKSGAAQKSVPRNAASEFRVAARRESRVAREHFAGYLLPSRRASPNTFVVDSAQPPTEAGALVILDQHFARGDDTGQNRHEDFFALYVVQSGRGVHVIDGHAYGVARGDVYITPPGTTHAYRDFDELRAVAFCFQAAFFREEELAALRATPGFWDFLTATESSEYSHSQFRDYRLHLPPELHAVAQKHIEEIKAESAPLHEAARRGNIAASNARHEKVVAPFAEAESADKESVVRQSDKSENARHERSGVTQFGTVQNASVEQTRNERDGTLPFDAAAKDEAENAARRVLVRALFFRLLVQLARWRGAARTESAARNENMAQRDNAPKNKNGAECETERREYSRAAPDREMAALLQFCEENFDQPLTVPQLAARAFLSTARFSEVFARHTGCPPAAYLRRLRLSRAQTLLRETSLPVGEIAARCGYGEAAQLSRAFRGAFKQSPSGYRAANRREK